MYLNRVRVLNCLFFVIIIVLMCLTTEILIAFGQDQETAHLAGTYTKTLIPGVFFLLQQ